MKNFLRRVIGAVSSLFTSDRAKTEFDNIADMVALALPVINQIGGFAVLLTPTALDDVALQIAREKFPRLFEPGLTGDELKLYLLGLAAEVLKVKVPNSSTTAARAAVQLAYAGQKFEQLSEATR